MKLSVSAYRAHASAHKKILDTAYQLNYGSTSASHYSNTMQPTCSGFQIDPPSGQHAIGESGSGPGGHDNAAGGGGGGDISSDDAATPLQSPRSQNTSREEDESSNANESDCKSPSQRTKSNQRWMKLRTTVQISSAMQKKPPLKREDSFLKRFSTRQIPETQETVEDTGSEGATGDSQGAPRRRRRVRKQPRTVVNPDENFYFYWLLVLTICVLYNMWTLIVRQSFPELQQLISSFWLLCDSLSDVVFILDVCVQLRTGYLEQGLMVYDSKKLAKHYLSSRAFMLDLAALCPLDLLQIKLGPQPMLRCPRFLKVYRAVNYYYMVESRTVYPNLWRVVNLIHILLILAHWFGCFYFLLSEAEGFQGDWVYPYRPGDYATLTRKYLGSLYWSTLTLTTIGDLPTPETNAEKTNSVDGPRSLPRRGVKSRLLQFNNNGGYVFTIVSYLIGVFIFATIVGQVGNVITNRNANRLEFERLLDGAKTYMRHHKVPGGMKRRVLRWYDYSWSRGRIQGGGDINTALGLLPDKLKTELALHVNLSVLKKVTIFQECQPEFLRDLVLKMKAYIFTPGDSICRKGEVAREMFIIADGILEVLSEMGKVLTTMKAGDFFGEIGILNLDGLNKRTADVRSVGYSELFSLSREDVLAAMKDYPEAQEILQALGRKRLMEVKASARQHAQHKDHHHHGAVDPKGLVDKIKNEAKGLRNALRKSRTHRRSQESLELQPLHTGDKVRDGGGNGKGMLKRMPRVKSHDLSQEENPNETGAVEATPSPLGAGLPLLQRLRLLKEKQDHEERASHCATPAILSPSPSSLKSPPPVPEEPQEVIGAGLPLLQRLLLLKNKEQQQQQQQQQQQKEQQHQQDHDAHCSLPTSPTSLTQTNARASFSSLLPTVGRTWNYRFLHSTFDFNTTSVKSSTLSPAAPRSSTTVSTSAPSKSGSIRGALAAGTSNSSRPSNRVSFRERLKLHTMSAKDPTKEQLLGSAAKDHGGTKETISESATILPSTTTELKTIDSVSESENDNMTADADADASTSKAEPPWSRLKKAAIISDPVVVPSTSNSSLQTSNNNKDEGGGGDKEEEGDKPDKEKKPPLKPKPNLVLTRKTKHYRYAARHSKLSKSVTFNRDTLQSPPNSANIIGTPPSLFPLNSPTGNGIDEIRRDDDGRRQDLGKCPISSIISTKANQMKLIKGSLDDEQQYFADILIAIKQVMGTHLQEVQEKFQQRFEKLEEEVRNKDETINKLKARIFELEKSQEDSFTDSMETIVGPRDLHHSWEDHSRRESKELKDLPETLTPQPLWPESPSVILDMDSTTDTDSEMGDSSEPGYESGEFENSGNNWEVEMLAAQMRERRSASLDHGAMRPIRKRFTRGSSAEHRRD